jgi:hypothetical protein
VKYDSFVFAGIGSLGVSVLIALSLILGAQERKSFLEKENARQRELAETRSDLGLALEQLGDAQEKLQETTRMIGRGQLTNGTYVPVFVSVIRTEDGKEFNVLFDGGNFPPIIVVKDIGGAVQEFMDKNPNIIAPTKGDKK